MVSAPAYGAVLPTSTRVPPGSAGASVAADIPSPPSQAAGWIAQLLARAERDFVAQVVKDGGIGPWRRGVGSRLHSARDAAVEQRLSRSETAALVVALLDIPVRDRCWLLVEADRDERWSVLWRHLARNAVSPFRAEPLFLLGWSAWRRGDAASTRAMTAAVLTEDPTHGAARMLLHMLQVGTDPTRLPSLAGGDRGGAR